MVDVFSCHCWQSEPSKAIGLRYEGRENGTEGMGGVKMIRYYYYYYYHYYYYYYYDY